jgi:ferritin-like metal-binding protein YciE
MEVSAKQTGLFDFFTQCLQDLYGAEKKVVKCYAALSLASFTPELQSALSGQSEEANSHISRLELIFGLLEHKPGKCRCEIIELLSDKAASIVKTVETGTALRDAEIIYAVQLIAHYKIASYGSLVSLMGEIGYPDAEMLLAQCLTEEKNADSYLTQIALNFINPAAKKESEKAGS